MTLARAIVLLSHERDKQNPLLDKEVIKAFNIAIHALQWIQHLRPFILKPDHSLLPGETLE